MEHYSIYVGAKRPATALIGFLEKGSGQTQLAGEPKEVTLDVGTHGFPNYSKVWGKRILVDSNGREVPTDLPVSLEDPKYKGDIKFLKYNDKSGYPIEIRYLDSCHTLDLQYQILRLKMVIKADEDKWYIKLPPGENRFDPKNQALFIQYLKVHHCNKHSKSKHPQAKTVMFEEISDETIDLTAAKTRESKGDAILLVKNAANKTGQIKALLAAIGHIPPEVSKSIDNRAPESEIYDGLLELADVDPQFMLDRINAYKRGLSDMFEKAKAFQIIDFSKHGQILVTVGNKKEVLLDKVQGTGDKLMQWLYDNFLNEDIFNALTRLKSITDKIT